MSYRRELEAKGYDFSHAKRILEDTDWQFVYEAAKGGIVGWTKCEFTYWRDQPHEQEHSPAPSLQRDDS